jgi:hypothetical protein
MTCRPYRAHDRPAKNIVNGTTRKPVASTITQNIIANGTSKELRNISLAPCRMHFRGFFGTCNAPPTPRYAMTNRQLMMATVMDAVKVSEGIPAFEATLEGVNCFTHATLFPDPGGPSRTSPLTVPLFRLLKRSPSCLESKTGGPLLCF